ncbi:MAG: hypothetical protein JXQ27_01560 [Acidobacteria bacterium]|nr:hypothetical protein [Acidobacteriota bacterium]
MFLYDKLQILIQIEKLMGQVYERCGEHFKNVPDTPRLFAALAAEEESHINQLQYLLRMIRRHPHDFEEVKMPMEESRALIIEMQQFLEKPIGPLAEAIRFAMRMENTVLEGHSRLVLAESHPHLSSLLKSLVTADKQHHARLHDFAIKKGILKADPAE